MELSLQCLYKVVFDDLNYVYSFTTKNDIGYDVAFSDSMSYFRGTSFENDLKEIYSLSIYKKSTQREPLDVEVRKTVDCILQHFFLVTVRSLLYVCDTSDKKEYKRFVKFNKWHFESSYKDNVTKVDESVTDQDGITYYSTLLFHNRNPKRNQLVQAHFEFIDSLRDK